MADEKFPETADIETSSDGYAARFAGPVGEWFLDVQSRIVLNMLNPKVHHSILDVGGGHGQLAAPLGRSGYNVEVLGSDDSCRNRIDRLVEHGRCTFKVGNVVELPYEDNSFDAVISFRLLPHCEQWQKLLSELCRVAKHCVIVDYPTKRSANAIAPMLFGAKKKVEGNTREWRMFSDGEVKQAFTEAGHAVTSRKPQFFMPMVLHRAMKSRAISSALEAIPRCLGLTSLFGSPVIAKAVPAGDQ